MLGPNKPSSPGVGKFRENIKNSKNSTPYGTTHYLSPGGWGCQKILGRIRQFSVGTERGSEYNTVERENSRKMMANGGGGLLKYYRALGGGGERESGKFYLTQPKPSHPPPFLGNKERTPY